MNTLIGILLVTLAGLGTGTIAWPMKLMRRLSFEQYWFLGMLVSLVIFPWAVVLCTVPRFWEVYAAVGWRPILLCNLFSMGWGIANVLYGICVLRIGAALTGARPLRRGGGRGRDAAHDHQGLGRFRRRPRAHLAARPGDSARCGGHCDWRRPLDLRRLRRDLALQKGAAVEETSGGFVAGLIMAVVAGVLSTGLMLGFVYTYQPTFNAVIARGGGELPAIVAAWAVGLLGGAAVNLGLSGLANDQEPFLEGPVRVGRRRRAGRGPRASVHRRHNAAAGERDADVGHCGRRLRHPTGPATAGQSGRGLPQRRVARRPRPTAAIDGRRGLRARCGRVRSGFGKGVDAMSKKKDTARSPAPAAEAIETALAAVGKKPVWHRSPDGSALLLLPYGARVLGLFAPGGGENFFWVNPALAAADSARKVFDSPGWQNSGGDRTWLSPEIDVFFPDYPRCQQHVEPATLDAAFYGVETRAGGVGMARAMTLRFARAKRSMRLRLTKWVGPAVNPLRYEQSAANLLDGVQYAGYTQRTEVTLLGESPPAPSHGHLEPDPASARRRAGRADLLADAAASPLRQLPAQRPGDRGPLSAHRHEPSRRAQAGRPRRGHHGTHRLFLPLRPGLVAGGAQLLRQPVRRVRQRAQGRTDRFRLRRPRCQRLERPGRFLRTGIPRARLGARSALRR